MLIFYAQDTLSNIRFLNSSDLEALKIAPEDLRKLAVGNLRQRLQGIDVRRGEMVSMVTAGGDYEASLILFDDLWEREAAKFAGEPVAAVPSRDLLLFADSKNPQAIAKLRELTEKVASGGAYLISDRLFVHRAGQWQVFNPTQ